MVKVDFDSPDDELRFLRALVRVQQLADEVLEDCLAQNLGLQAALDVYLTQCARMIHARGAWVQLTGSRGPVIERVWGQVPADIDRFAEHEGAVALDRQRTLFVSQLELAHLKLGAIGFIVPGHFEGGGTHVHALVDAVAETLDSAVLSFLAVGDGHGPLERLDELHEENDFRPSGRIGRYELVTPLGTGGMAQVMVARTLGPQGVGRLVALKRMLPHLVAEPGMVEQFLDEARLGMRLHHPNLVTFHDFGQSATGGYFIAMEFVRGIDFDQLIYASASERLPLAVVSGIVCQALEGLHAAHELHDEDGHFMGLVHRDLSPHNVMVGFDGQVKVLDFGVAKVRAQRTVTLPGIVKGKPVYMSPEQATAERVDRQSDLFAVGLILYEALVGRRAFDTGNDTQTMEAIVNDPLPRPGDIGPELWKVIDRALSKRALERPRTALELRDELMAVVAPATRDELGRFAAGRFPQKVVDCAQWDKLAAQASRLRAKVDPAVRRG